MGNSSPTIIGNVVESFYYEDMKAIRAVLHTDSGKTIKIELPITLFKFQPEMDENEEMRKTALLMRGKKIELKSTAEPA